MFDTTDTESTSSQLLAGIWLVTALSRFLPPQFTRTLAWGHYSPLQHTEHLPQSQDQCGSLPGDRPKAHVPSTQSSPCWCCCWFCSCLSPMQYCLVPGNRAPSRNITHQLGFRLVLHTLSPGWGSSPWSLRPEILLWPLNHLGNWSPAPKAQILKQSPTSKLQNLY